MSLPLFRVSDLVVDWVGMTRIFSIPFMPWLIRNRQKGLDNWARWWNIQIKVNPTQVHEQLGHPVINLSKRGLRSEM